MKVNLKKEKKIKLYKKIIEFQKTEIVKNQTFLDKQLEKIAAAQEKLEVLEDFREQQGEE